MASIEELEQARQRAGQTQSVLDQLAKQAQPRPDLGVGPVSTFAARMVKPGETATEVLAKTPTAELESAGKVPDWLPSMIGIPGILRSASKRGIKAAETLRELKRILGRNPTEKEMRAAIPNFGPTPEYLKEINELISREAKKGKAPNPHTKALTKEQAEFMQKQITPNR